MPVNSLPAVKDRLLAAQKILVTCHIVPDGDAIGSVIALGLALQKMGKSVTIHSADGVPNRFRFLKGAEQVTSTINENHFDCVVAVDCADHRRFLPIKEKIDGLEIINIDHHPTNSMFGHLNYVDPTAAATGEIIFTLLEELDFVIDTGVAESLYTAISTDTGSFKFDSTTERTHQIAGKLLAAGVRPGTITPRLFDLRTRSGVSALRLALCSLSLTEDGKIAWFVLTDEQLRQAGIKDEDLDGVVNYAKNIEGVEVGIIFREKGDGTVKVGFRSFDIDVAKIAAAFGGGGHKKASGCSLEMNLHLAVEEILAAVKKELIL